MDHVHLAGELADLQVPHTPKPQPVGMLNPAAFAAASTVSVSSQAAVTPDPANRISAARRSSGTKSSSTGASARVSTASAKLS